LGLETGYTPALARLICLEGADETSYQKAETHLLETAGIEICARQIQRVAQRVGAGAQEWQEREVDLKACPTQRVPILYVSADGTGVPMRKEELAGRPGKGPEGLAKTRQAYLGCVFTQHGVDEKGHPVRITNRPLMCPVWRASTILARACGARPFVGAWAEPKRLFCSWMEPKAWNIWAGSVFAVAYRLSISTTRWNIPAKCCSRCWETKTTPSTNDTFGAGQTFAQKWGGEAH